MKALKLWVVAVMALWLAWPAGATDLLRGITFTDGQRLTASQLHQLIDDTSISTQFYTSQAAEATLPTGDYFLVYSPTLTGFRKLTASAALYGNTALITSQTEKAVPAAGDYVLLYDAAGTVLKKASVGNLVWNNTNVFLAASNITSATSTALLLLNQGGTNASITVSNLLWGFDYTKPFTNLLTHTSPTNEDRLLIWDSLNATNKTTTLAGLFTNLPSATVSNTDVFMSVRAGTGVVQQVTLAQLQTTISNNIVAPAVTNFITGEYTLADGLIANTNHGFASLPRWVRWVLVCKTADVGYSVGDEVDVAMFDTTDDRPPWVGGGNSTNLFLVQLAGFTSCDVPNKTNGAQTSITYTRWKAKGYAHP